MIELENIPAELQPTVLALGDKSEEELNKLWLVFSLSEPKSPVEFTDDTYLDFLKWIVETEIN